MSGISEISDRNTVTPAINENAYRFTFGNVEIPASTSENNSVIVQSDTPSLVDSLLKGRTGFTPSQRDTSRLSDHNPARANVIVYPYTANQMNAEGYSTSALNSLPIMVASGPVSASLGEVFSAASQIISPQLIAAGFKATHLVDLDHDGVADAILVRHVEVTPPASTVAASTPAIARYEASHSSEASHKADKGCEPPVKKDHCAADKPVVHNTVSAPVYRPLVIPSLLPSISSPLGFNPLATGSAFAIPGSRSALSTMPYALSNFNVGLNLPSPLEITSAFSLLDPTPLVAQAAPATVNPAAMVANHIMRSVMPAGYGPWGYVPETKTRSEDPMVQASNVTQYAYQVNDFTPMHAPMTASVAVTASPVFEGAQSVKKNHGLKKSHNVPSNPHFVAQPVKTPPLTPLNREQRVSTSQVSGVGTSAIHAADSYQVTYGNVSIPSSDATPYHVTYGNVTLPLEGHSTDNSSAVQASFSAGADPMSYSSSLNASGELPKGQLFNLADVTPSNVASSYQVSPGFGAGVAYMH
jgi:hypothetical protein